MAKNKTPTGVSLEQLLKEIIGKGQEVPDEIRDLVYVQGTDKEKRMVGIEPEEKVTKQTPAQAPKKATDKGEISIDELIDKFIKDGEEIPDEVRDMVYVKGTEEQKRKVGIFPERQQHHPRRKKTAPAAPSHEAKKEPVKPDVATEHVDVEHLEQARATEPRKSKKSKKSGFGRRFMGGMLKTVGAKGLVEKLNKPPAESHDTTEHTVLESLTAIRMDLASIKHALHAGAGPAGTTHSRGHESTEHRPGFLKRFGAGFVRGITSKKIDPKWSHYSKPKATKVTKPVVTPTPTVERITPPQAVAAVEDMKAKLKPTDQEEEKVEQGDNEKKKEAKDLNEHLDTMKKDLDDLKKHQSHSGAWIMGILGLAWGAIKWLKNKLGDAWKILSEIGGKIGKIFEWVGSKVIGGVKAVGGAIARGARAAGSAIRKGWGALTKKTGGAAEGMGKKLGMSGETMGKVGSVAKGVGRFAGGAAAGYDVATGVIDLAEGKRQTEMSGWDMISPMRWGMYAGEKINQGVSSLTGGEDASEWISRKLSAQDYDPNKGIPYTKAPPGLKAAPKPQAAALQAATTQAKELNQQASSQPQVVVVKGGDSNKVIPVQKDSGGPNSVVITTRNPESSISRLNSLVFDNPAGYDGLSRL